MELNELTIVDARKKLDKGEITAVDLTRACLARLRAINPELNACLAIGKDEAVAAARAADERLQAGERGTLLGIPYLAKDNILTKGLKTTAASRLLADYVAPYDATVIKKLKAVGAILLGKTNLDEFAHGASTEYSHFGPTRNPYDRERVPGGSSGGSAAAVAANLCLFALGTDTGGSVRHPASFCGVVGYKPTYGLLSRFGLIAMTSSTDVPGVLAKSAADAVLVAKELAGVDKLDSTTVKAGHHQAIVNKGKTPLAGVTIGVPEEYFPDNLSGQVKEKVLTAIARLEKLGARLLRISLPYTKYGVSVYYIITPAEISSNLARFDGLRYGLHTAAKDLAAAYLENRGQGFGVEVKRRLMLGTYALSAGYHDAYYLQAQTVRTKIIEDFNNAFAQVDVIAAPTTPSTAFRLGEQNQDPLKMYLEDIFLTPASLAGLPAINLPVGLINGLPIGYQLIGPRLADENLLAVATAWEKGQPRLKPKL